MFLDSFRKYDLLAWIRTGKRVATTPYDIRLTMDDPSQIERAILSGEYKNHMVEHLSSSIEERSLKFADIGSNIGFYSLLFDKLSAKESRVDAFEPVPKNISKLYENMRLNESTKIDVHSCAIGDADGSEIEINVPDRNESEATVASETWSGDSFDRSLYIQQRTLDSLYSQTMPPDVIQIDAEGSEVSILRGASDVLQQHPELYVVVHPNLIRSVGDSISGLTEVLSDCEYDECYDLVRKKYYPINKLEGTITADMSARYIYLEDN